MKPRARGRDLVVHEIDGEVVVYDLARHRAHRLNRAAALVWRACNGRRTVDEIASHVRRALDGADRELVWAALGKLDRAHLLDEPIARRVSRRRALRALLVAPVVVSLLAPSPAQAASCVRSGNPCGTQHEECCSMMCIGGRCV